jgi:hypothetical protein
LFDATLIAPYLFLGLAIADGIFDILGTGDKRQALFFLIVSCILFERLAFTELLEEKNQEIEELKSREPKLE